MVDEIRMYVGSDLFVVVFCVLDVCNPDVESDLLLAQMLQSQFDKENDHIVNIYEQKYNGNSKGN